MKRMIRIVAMLLVLFTICQLLAGCTGTAREDLITKGAFYSLFIEKKNLYSDVYTEEEMYNSETYDIEEAIMLEWELIDQEQLGDLNDYATKELVAQICVRLMAFRQTHELEIKDIQKCHDQQAIKDAVGMKLFDLSNGYFDARHTMTYGECEAVIERASTIEAETEFENNELDIEYQDDVIDISDLELLELSFGNQEDDLPDIVGESAFDYEVEADEEQMSARVVKLDANNSEPQIVSLASNEVPSYVKIPKLAYDGNPMLYQEGKVLFYDPRKPRDLGNGKLPLITDAFAAEITGVTVGRFEVTLTLAPCSLERLIKDTDGINKNTTLKDQEIVEEPKASATAKENGFTLKKTASGKGIVATFHHTFSLEDKIYTKQTWRNAKATPSITLTATIDNFRVTTKNLGKLLLGKKNTTGTVKVSFDTSVEFDAKAGGLRYSPANNGNGKFLSNLKNSRWTGAAAGGSEMIKLGTAKIPLGTSGFSIDCTFYLYVQMDGSLNIKVSTENHYLVSIKKGKAVVTNESKTPKLNNLNINANIKAGVQAMPKVKFWSFNVVDATAKAGVNLNASASIYEKDNEEKPQASGVYATQTELDEQSSDYSYCLDASLKFEISGQLMTTDSVIGKFVIKTLKCKAVTLEKSWELGSSHFEDGHFVSSCSRGGKQGVVEVNSDKEIYLASYKENMEEGDEVQVAITSIPMNDKKLKKCGGIEVATKNKKIAKVSYDKNTKTLIVKAKKEGSTEITVRIKKSKNSKKYYSQTISITVAENDGVKFEGVATISPKIGKSVFV